MAPTNIAQRQFKATLAPGTGFSVNGITNILFNQVSGAGMTADVVKVWNGGETQPVLLSGPTEHENLTVEKPFDVEADWNAIKDLRALVGRLTGTVTVTTGTRDLVFTNGKSRVYNVLLIGLTEPDYDSTSGDAATWGMEFAVSSIAP